MKKSICLIVLLTTMSIMAENKYENEAPQFSNNKYLLLENKVAKNKKDTAKAFLYANSWLEEAKKDKNNEQQAKAYKVLMHLVEKKFRMIYADSLLNKALDTKNAETIGGAYLTIGIAYYDNKEYPKALDSYLLADSYIDKTKNQYLIHKVKYTIAQTKFYLGYFDEAISLFTECIKFFREENETAYIKSLHGIALCYNQIGRFDLCSFYNLLGLKVSIEFDNDEMIPYFNNSEGINQYKLMKYEKAIKLLEETMSEIEKRKDYVSQTITWFYLGKCYWETNQKSKAAAYFLKADEIITTENFIRPDLRENYELLIEYYRINNNTQQQLMFIDKLLAIDKTLYKNFKYLSYKIHKDFDTKSLLHAKEEIETKMIVNKRIYTSIFFLLTASITGLTVWHFKSKKRDKQKFNEIMMGLPKTSTQVSLSTTKTKAQINPDVTNEILRNLQKFEAKRIYLEKDMSLVKMASILNTNTKYASIIISEYRSKKLTNYINDLKIDYIVELLKNQNKFRNYTNKALAEEAGFGSTQIFTKAFINRNKISPTYFIQELNKQSVNKV
jgi:tetratricopeptide (TPR) repeat protein